MIDFHGGPRASLLTWLSGAPVRVGYDVAGRGWMYTTRVARPRELRPRHAVQNQWDLLAALGLPDAGRERSPVEMPVDPAAAAAMAERLARAGVQADRSARRRARQRRQPVSPLAAAFVRRAGRPPGLDRRHPRRRHVGAVGARGGPPRGRRRAWRLPPADATGCSTSANSRWRSCEALLERAALFIGGDSGPLHIAATSAVPIVGAVRTDAAGAVRAVAGSSLVTESVEVTGLPCRPCDQRVCVPGDFRCLTRISADMVFAAADRALARANRRSLEMQLRLRGFETCVLSARPRPPAPSRTCG